MEMRPHPIVIVGCGPGSPEYLAPAALRAIQGAELLVGAKRLLDLFPSAGGERIVMDADAQGLLDEMEVRAGSRAAVVLVTGDPGLFSLARSVIRRFGRERCRVIPGISSVQVAFARLCLDWADARIVSAHGGDPHPDPSLWQADKIAVLGGREGSIRWIARAISQEPPGEWRLFVCENLTLDDERVREVEPSQLSSLEASPSTVVLIIRGRAMS
jgi:precorrin-6y C5,15-methyltransferase (decarboxylating) CbiE subunit